MKRLTALIALLLLVPAVSVLATPPVVVTFCHVAGLEEDPANTVTLTLPVQAVYGQAGHFNEDGTPNAGHEQDHLGACQPTTTTTVIVTTTTTEGTTTTTGQGTTTTQPPNEQTTTTATVAQCPPGTIHQPPLCVAPPEVLAETVVPSTAPAAETLPFTGASTGMLALSAFAFLLLGLSTLKLARR